MAGVVARSVRGRGGAVKRKIVSGEVKGALMPGGENEKAAMTGGEKMKRPPVGGLCVVWLPDLGSNQGPAD